MLNTANQIVPFHFHGSQVRVVKINDEPYFVGKDVCAALSLVDHRKTLSRLDKDERREWHIVTPSGNQAMIVLNESGLYHLIFKSMKPEAKAFRKWVTSEVLPALRKRGVYEVGEERNLPKAPKTGHTVQGTLWPQEPEPNHDLARARSLMLDVALQAKPGSKVAQLVRLIKPMVMEGQSL